MIEHVGVVGDTAELYPDFYDQRLQFISEACRILKPDGCVIIACPNKLFPGDFQHNISRTKFFHLIGEKTGLSFHSPFDPMLLSYGDIERYCCTIADEYSPKFNGFTFNGCLAITGEIFQ